MKEPVPIPNYLKSKGSFVVESKIEHPFPRTSGQNWNLFLSFSLTLPGTFPSIKEKVKITGTGAVLVAAKKKGIIEKVAPALDELLEFGYRISGALRKRILELAEEAE